MEKSYNLPSLKNFKTSEKSSILLYSNKDNKKRMKIVHKLNINNNDDKQGETKKINNLFLRKFMIKNDNKYNNKINLSKNKSISIINNSIMSEDNLPLNFIQLDKSTLKLSSKRYFQYKKNSLYDIFSILNK